MQVMALAALDEFGQPNTAIGTTYNNT